jgi:putative DNA methylase
VNPFSGVTGDYGGAVEWVGKVAAHLDMATRAAEPATITCESALQISGTYDAIVTDPPYYDAIPYSDLADFFHVWLRRALWGFSSEFDANFHAPLGPKWAPVISWASPSASVPRR